MDFWELQSIILIGEIGKNRRERGREGDKQRALSA